MTAKTKPATKPSSKSRKHNPEATERLRKAASKEIGERLAKAEAADASPTAATPPATDGGKEPKKDKAPKMPKLAKSADGGSTAKQLGGLDAAAIVLKKAGVPMTCKEVWAKIDEQKMWFTEGKTPEATIYSAILREIKAKGKDARFRKAARGKFEFCGKEG